MDGIDNNPGGGRSTPVLGQQPEPIGPGERKILKKMVKDDDQDVGSRLEGQPLIEKSQKY